MKNIFLTIFAWMMLFMPLSSISLVHVSSDGYDLIVQAPAGHRECISFTVLPTTTVNDGEELFFNVELYNKTDKTKHVKGSVQWFPDSPTFTITYDDAQRDTQTHHDHEYHISAYRLNMKEIRAILSENNITIDKPDDFEHASEKIKNLSYWTQYQLSRHRTKLKIPSITLYEQHETTDCDTIHSALAVTKDGPFTFGHIPTTVIQHPAGSFMEKQDESISSALSENV